MVRIVIGSYGTPWLPHHGASGGVSFSSRLQAEGHVYEASHWCLPGYRSPEQCGLWPGSPHRIVTVEIDGDESKGWLVATCEPEKEEQA